MLRLFPLFLVLVLLGVLPARAQVRMAVTTDSKVYLTYELIKLTVTVQNFSGNTLDFADPAQDYMRLDIINNKGRRIVENLEYEVGTDATGKRVRRDRVWNGAAGMTLGSGASKTKTIPVNLHYDMTAPGQYDITVRLHHHRLPTVDILSSTVRVEVKNGKVLWQQELGLATAPDQPIKTRTAKFIKLQTDDGQLGYLQIEDDAAVHAVIRLAPFAEGSPPQFEVDGRNFVHLLVTTAPRRCSYYVYDLQGNEKEHRDYQTQTDTPQLIKDPDIGRVMVAGGQPIIVGADATAEDRPVMMMR